MDSAIEGMDDRGCIYIQCCALTSDVDVFAGMKTVLGVLAHIFPRVLVRRVTDQVNHSKRPCIL